MKFPIAAVVLATHAQAFPSFVKKLMTDDNLADISKLANLETPVAPAAHYAMLEEYREKIKGGLLTPGLNRRDLGPQGAGALPLVPPEFDAGLQYVDVTGEHAFVPPGPGDERGFCAGLNILANHNFIPHNGKASITQIALGMNQVFGMGLDLSTFLAVFAAIFDGDGLVWSVGGTPHEGISGSHGNYEADSSPFRGDLNQYGSNTVFVWSQFFNFYDRQPDPETANYNIDIIRDYRIHRISESIEKNPWFTYNFFSGSLVTSAAYTFIYRFMANKSEEYPEGILNKQNLKTFLSLHGDDSNLTFVPGHERIPENWYKRAVGDEYSIPYYLADLLYFGTTAPQVIVPGCNLGSVNSYNSLGPELLTNGVYTTAQLLENPLCFSAEFIMSEIPGLTGLSIVDDVLDGLLSQARNIIAPLNCPSIGKVNQSALAICPGLSIWGGPLGTVAPGAIQDHPLSGLGS